MNYVFPKPFKLDKCVEDYMDDLSEVSDDLFIDRERITDRVLKDLLKQKNVRAEFEKLYHKEWQNK